MVAGKQIKDWDIANRERGTDAVIKYLAIDPLLLGILSDDSGEMTDLFAPIQIDRAWMSRTIQEQV